ncbi:MAG TPA: hypothetical protein VF337_01070 [Candidatus Limnocylindrales bacterium]
MRTLLTRFLILSPALALILVGVAAIGFEAGANSGGTTRMGASQAGNNPAGAQPTYAPLPSGALGGPRQGAVASVQVVGTVASKTATTIVVTTTAGKTVAVNVSSTTIFTIRDVANPTIDTIAVGNRIAAQGTFNADGSLNATQILVGAFGQPDSRGGSGRGREANPSSSPSGANT